MSGDTSFYDERVYEEKLNNLCIEHEAFMINVVKAAGFTIREFRKGRWCASLPDSGVERKFFGDTFIKAANDAYNFIKYGTVTTEG